MKPRGLLGRFFGKPRSKAEIPVPAGLTGTGPWTVIESEKTSVDADAMILSTPLEDITAGRAGAYANLALDRCMEAAGCIEEYKQLEGANKTIVKAVHAYTARHFMHYIFHYCGMNELFRGAFPPFQPTKLSKDDGIFAILLECVSLGRGYFESSGCPTVELLNRESISTWHTLYRISMNIWEALKDGEYYTICQEAARLARLLSEIKEEEDETSESLSSPRPSPSCSWAGMFSPPSGAPPDFGSSVGRVNDLNDLMRPTDPAKPEHEVDPNARWGNMEIVRPKLSVPKKSESRGLRPSFVGGPVYTWRVPPAYDGRICRSPQRAPGGTVLVDCSGSMGTPPLEAILEMAPEATIALYAGTHGSSSGGTSCGKLVIVAERRRAVGDVGAVRKEHLNIHNIVDGPALRWLARQQRPRIWIGDGKITGFLERTSPLLEAECRTIVRCADIVQFESYNDWMDALRKVGGSMV